MPQMRSNHQKPHRHSHQTIYKTYVYKIESKQSTMDIDHAVWCLQIGELTACVAADIAVGETTRRRPRSRANRTIVHEIINAHRITYAVSNITTNCDKETKKQRNNKTIVKQPDK